MQVLKLIVVGKPHKETAADLGLSIKTIEKHRNRIYRYLNHQHLDIHCIAKLTHWALANGFVQNLYQTPGKD